MDLARNLSKSVGKLLQSIIASKAKTQFKSSLALSLRSCHYARKPLLVCVDLCGITLLLLLPVPKSLANMQSFGRPLTCQQQLTLSGKCGQWCNGFGFK